MDDELILLGQIVRYQGNKGHVRVEPLTNNIDRFFQLEDVVVEKSPGNSRYEIESTRTQNDFVVLKLAGVDDIEAAEELKGSYISIYESELPRLSEDEYYIYRLEGFTVVTSGGRKLGELMEVWTDSGTDVFVVRNDDREEYLIPAAREIISEIDQEKRRITVEPIPGLLEL
ncbi:ribosome maturation factor RimM [Halarsenatibacter silvermanii]|uniref:Ribosome maturation factor RimM n=1 Tax=Halarsenatibacter silvermanii TaxID=321763 RepID=A0A1G9PHF5_9FIRM|nr:ribosome maturation factor RimM [Halarsenatibacter silvermanii]SDL98169.1 16S rRNA processing protein RimM [Halarsenatibacter silvermanii]